MSAVSGLHADWIEFLESLPAKERKQRGKTGQPLTPTGANGYFIPILPLAQANHTLPTPPTPAIPVVRLSVAAWMGAELIDLFPWRGSVVKEDLLYNLIGLLLAALTTWAWLLGAAGRLDHPPILGWWLAWSLYEVAVRMKVKPVVREGAWWARHFRPAQWADMAAYVGIKNLLLASLLFFVMAHDTGLGQWLQHLPGMSWLEPAPPSIPN